jgi:hypothetical protein
MSYCSRARTERDGNEYLSFFCCAANGIGVDGARALSALSTLSNLWSLNIGCTLEQMFIYEESDGSTDVGWLFCSKWNRCNRSACAARTDQPILTRHRMYVGVHVDEKTTWRREGCVGWPVCREWNRCGRSARAEHTDQLVITQHRMYVWADVCSWENDVAM